MSNTLFLLRLEHGNLSKLLGLIEDQVAAADAGGPVDEELLRLASEYFLDYPDRCHHPKEDLVYRLLSKRAPDSCAGLRDLIADHARLHELTQAFAVAAPRMREQPQAREPSPPREVVRAFTQHYRQHIRVEEERFFRLAEERLSEEDWYTLDYAIFEEDDPLFGLAAEQRFAALSHRIETLAEEGKAHQSVIEAGAELRELSNIERFNESMRSTGESLRLARFATGGYALEHDRKLLLYIPECSAERAAWCAHCFLRGRGWPWVRQHS